MPPVLAALWLCGAGPLAFARAPDAGAAAQDRPQPPASAPLPPADPAATAAPAIGALTLDAALALAAERSPALSAARNELEAAEGGVTQAGVLPNPEVAVLMEDTRRDSRTTTAQLNVPLELGGKRAARLGAAGKSRELARSQLAAAQVELRSAVYAAFFNVLVAQERARLARDATTLAANASRVATRRVTAGKAAPLEQTKSEVEQANAALEQADADAALALARHALASLCGIAVAAMPAADAHGPTLTPAAAQPDTAVLENALELAPALEASRIELERRRAVVGLERSRQYPDVTLTLGTKRDNSTDRGTMPVVGVSIPLPLFDRNQGNVYTAMRQADKAADEYRATRLRLANELRQATTQLSVSRTLADTLGQTVVPAASQAYDAAVRGFEAGKFGFLDVLDAQRTLLQARIRHLNAVAASHKAAAAIDRILGQQTRTTP